MKFVITDSAANAHDLLALLDAAELCGLYVGYADRREGVAAKAAHYLPNATLMLIVLDEPPDPKAERRSLLEAVQAENVVTRVIYATPSIAALQRVYRPDEHPWLATVVKTLSRPRSGFYRPKKRD